MVVPISMFADSGDQITVTSLTGDAIRRINLTVTDRFGPPRNVRSARVQAWIQPSVLDFAISAET